ncbi:MAG TPA: polysaccharide deacetylase family protein [Candidatus Marinimicrobia bacterium]|nr:polysaccharide deacetylase family protein [Candidatus Neomarinimicrobiota bacterium]
MKRIKFKEIKIGFIVLFGIISIFTENGMAQKNEKNVWNNKKCAVCLTYDDALNVHLDSVIPVLDSLGLKGTFYLSGNFQTVQERTNDWKSAAVHGHELGNHTLFHPCDGKMPGRSWVNPDYDLSNYTLSRITDEIKMNNALLQIIDGKSQRTFAYPCGDMQVGGVSYVDVVKENFLAARSTETRLETINDIDLYNIGCFMINGESGAELIDLAKTAFKNKALLVFLFHGVGGEHNINVSFEAHNQLVNFLKQNENDIWIAPLAEIAKYVADYQGKIGK